MSTNPSEPRPPETVPAPPRVDIAGPPQRPRRFFLRALLFVALVLSLAVNFLLISTVPGCNPTIEERYYSGKSAGHDKIAVVKVEGVLLEGLTGYAEKQIEKAAADHSVKAVVVRINSPGGTITAADELHRRLTELRDGNPDKHTDPKPLVVSMASLAASGGYYIAMPAKVLFAERTTITGSIGVYAAFPNVTELADKYGVRLDIIKAGRVKDSGSMFHNMTPDERQLWQDMVDHAYSQFLAVVEDGRPLLKDKLLEQVLKKRLPKAPTTGGEAVDFYRQRADGGIFTSDQALQLGLIDKIGYLEDAIKEVKRLANLGDDVRVVTYDRPPSLLTSLLGAEVAPSEGRLDPGKLAAGAVPRLWYLTPQSEMAGILAAIGAGGR
jgi:protease-4